MRIVVLTPDQLSAIEPHENTRLMTVNETIHNDLLSEAENLAQPRPLPPTEVIIRAQTPYKDCTGHDFVKLSASDLEPVAKRKYDVVSDKDS